MSTNWCEYSCIRKPNGDHHDSCPANPSPPDGQTTELPESVRLEAETEANAIRKTTKGRSSYMKRGFLLGVEWAYERVAIDVRQFKEQLSEKDAHRDHLLKKLEEKDREIERLNRRLEKGREFTPEADQCTCAPTIKFACDDSHCGNCGGIL